MKRIWQIPVLLGGLLAASRVVHAHCPLCTAAVGAGILGAQSLGLGDGIVGVFVGAFAVSTGLWFARKIKTRFIPLQTPLIVLASFLLTMVPLHALGQQVLYVPLLWFGEAGTFFNQAHFWSKLIIGSMIGGIVSLLAFQFHALLKQWKGRVFFPYQGIVVTVLSLVLTSGILFIVWSGG